MSEPFSRAGTPLLSWNVNGRVKTVARRQTDAVLGRAPDVITLQELRLNVPQELEPAEPELRAFPATA